jgi:hypothetical protein
MKDRLNEKGMGFFEFLFWVALLAAIGFLVWKFLNDPDSQRSRSQDHNSYEDKPKP